jgi:hypothetical protein
MEYLDALSIHSADTLREKQRLTELLKIPVSNLVFSRFYCELFVSQQSIGFLSITRSSLGIQYETSRTALQKLNWAKIYLLNRAELDEKIARKIRRKSFNVIPVSFGRLYIEDKENQLIASFSCSFSDFLWSVTDESILASAE